MADFEIFDIAFPLTKATTTGAGALLHQVVGTAFPIGGSFWVTAAHALGAANSMGFLRGDEWLHSSIAREERMDEYDIAIFEAIVERKLAPLHWINAPLRSMSQVVAIGFPYAYDPELAQVNHRCFTGAIVAPLNATTRIPAQPPIYELQFQCPRGLSGAPLIFNHANRFAVAGVVVGNVSTEMLVLSDKEILKDGSTSIVQRYEMLQLGIALQSAGLFDLHFEILGMTLGEHLKRHRLL
jgi:hypothetical protein